MNDQIQVQSDSVLEGQAQVNVHLMYENPLTLKELSEILNLINKAINDVNRKEGGTSNFVLGREYATIVSGIEPGSIILQLIAKFVSQIHLSDLCKMLYEKFSETQKKSRIKINGSNNKVTISNKNNDIQMIVKGNNNTIEIKIKNS